MNDLFQTAPTHDDLVQAAAVWLRGQRCVVIITEMTTGAQETPDAIGWTTRESILVECKTSVADFRADSLKSFRREPEFGMGDMRYFCAPVGMIAPEKLPPKWGLIEWNGTRMKVIKKAERWQRRIGEGRERSLLVSALRRVAHDAPKGISVTCYTYETKCRASLGVAAENDQALP